MIVNFKEGDTGFAAWAVGQGALEWARRQAICGGGANVISMPVVTPVSRGIQSPDRIAILQNWDIARPVGAADQVKRIR